MVGGEETRRHRRGRRDLGRVERDGVVFPSLFAQRFGEGDAVLRLPGVLFVAVRFGRVRQRIERRPVGEGQRVERAEAFRLVAGRELAPLGDPRLHGAAAGHGEVPPGERGDLRVFLVERLDGVRFPLAADDGGEQPRGGVRLVEARRVAGALGKGESAVHRVDDAGGFLVEGFDVGGVRVVVPFRQLRPHPLHEPQLARRGKPVVRGECRVEPRGKDRVDAHRVGAETATMSSQCR